VSDWEGAERVLGCGERGDEGLGKERGGMRRWTGVERGRAWGEEGVGLEGGGGRIIGYFIY